MNASLLQMMMLGFAASLTLIVAIGAQNAYVLRLGVEGRGRILVTVILICAFSDAILISAGVAGIGAVLEAAPRWWWAFGAICASFSWFFLLGYGARMLKPLFARPAAWRVLDGLIAAVMVSLGVGLIAGIA